ncbi:MAG: YceI family protein [Saprospiraceae bacterium]
MKKLVLFLAFVMVSIIAAQAAPGPMTFKVDVAKSTFKWTGKKISGSHWGYIKLNNGMFTVSNGSVTSGDINVNMNTIDCQDTQGEYGDKLVGHLKSDDFFGVSKFPASMLKIKSVMAKGGNQYDVKADLTIKGITHELSFPATIDVKGTEMKATAKVMVERTKYGIRYGSGSFFENLGDKAIDNNFEMEVNLVAMGAAPAAPAVTTKKAAKKSKS